MKWLWGAGAGSLIGGALGGSVAELAVCGNNLDYTPEVLKYLRDAQGKFRVYVML